MIQRDTRQEAKAYDRYLGEHADEPVPDAWMKRLVAFTKGHPQEYVQRLRHSHALCAGGVASVGTADEIAEKLVGFTRAGLDGMLVSWADFEDGLEPFVGTSCRGSRWPGCAGRPH